MNFFSGPIVRALIAGRDGAPSTRRTPKPEPKKSAGALCLRLADGLESADEGKCWIFNTPHGERAYGVLNVYGKSVSSHRLAYQLAKGPIPKGKYILHSCDTPACINPAHLRAGTAKENMQDYRERGCRFPPLPKKPKKVAPTITASMATPTEVKEYLGVNHRQFTKMVESGQIPARKYGKTVIRVPLCWLREQDKVDGWQTSEAMAQECTNG